MKGQTMRKRRENGQGMTEYILIVALVAILTITVVAVFGKQIRAMFASSTDRLTGDDTPMEKFNDEDDNAVDQDLSDF